MFELANTELLLLYVCPWELADIGRGQEHWRRFQSTLKLEC